MRGGVSGPEELRMSAAQGRAYLRLVMAERFDERPCRDALAWDMPEKPRGSWRTGDCVRARADAMIRDAEQHRRNACYVCPVLRECRAYANTHPDVTGVLAALSDKERHDRAKKARTA